MPAPFTLDTRLAADTHRLASWPLCEVLLMDDASYPWLILVPRRAGLRDLDDLADAEQPQLSAEILRASRALKAAFKPDKMNVAALGNAVPQLHVHVIARFTSDPAWPKPVWGAVERRPYDEEPLKARKAALMPHMNSEPTTSHVTT